MTDSAGERSFLTDELGSTLALTDSTGTAQTSYTFEPFGSTGASGSATTNSFAYTGRELDAGNLYYYRARYYNPSLQRFLSEDPLGFAGGDLNLYGYASNSPTDFADPTGQTIGISWGPTPLPGLPDAGSPGRDDAYLQFITAMLYLSQSPDASAIIQDLEQSPEVYLVGVSDRYKEDLRLSNDIVTWNPHKAACVNKGVQSPALQLFHELVHLWEKQHGLDSHDEEATTQLTNPVALQLGEPTRKNYDDARYDHEPWALPIPSSPMAGKNCRCK